MKSIKLIYVIDVLQAMNWLLVLLWNSPSLKINFICLHEIWSSSWFSNLYFIKPDKSINF